MSDDAAGELRQAVAEIGDAFHHAERERTEPDRREVQRQHRGHRLVTEVGQKRREDDADDGAAQPRRTSHRAIVASDRVAAMPELIKVERRPDGVVWVTLNRPDARNALSRQTNLELLDLADTLDQEEQLG